MCRFKNWYSDENRYVIQCEDCLHLQVSFGTTMLTMDEKQYKQFAQMVLSKMDHQQPMQDTNCKCIVLQSHVDAVNLILSEHELMQLHDMMQAVDTEMRTKELMDLF